MADLPNTLHVERYKHCTCAIYVSVFFDNLVQNVRDHDAGGGRMRLLREHYSHGAVDTLNSSNKAVESGDVLKGEVAISARRS
jgi:hypothetical protein